MNARAESALTHRTAFSDRLRMLLVQKGHALVPAQLAHSFHRHTGKDLRVQSFGNWLNGLQIPNHGNLIALAAFLSVTPEYLLEGTPVLQFAPVKHADLDTAQLVDHFQRLTPYGRKVALEMLAGLAKLTGGAA